MDVSLRQYQIIRFNHKWNPRIYLNVHKVDRDSNLAIGVSDAIFREYCKAKLHVRSQGAGENHSTYCEEQVSASTKRGW
jgi:hypothetical protein